MRFYANEHDRFAAAWLRAALPEFHVDERSIKDVSGSDLAGVERAHFFAGIGGWELALRLAGWPATLPVWTGSCPCQPFSGAGGMRGAADERHLWPEFFRLIRERRPPVVLGEQVAGAVGFGWLDLVAADLESAGYSVGAAILGAHSVGGPHKRDRLYWVASYPVGAGGSRLVPCGGPGIIGPWRWRGEEDLRLVFGSPFVGGDRWPQPLVRGLDDGVPSRVGRLRAYGNAIVPQVAAVFLRACLDALKDEGNLP